MSQTIAQSAQPEPDTVRPISAWARWGAVIVGTFFLFSILAVFSLKWINPPTTSFMIQRSVEAWWQGNDSFQLEHEWTTWPNISPYMKIAVITAEDQNFAHHWGFDLESIQDAVNEYSQGERLRGASTISQQVAKNLFLWPGRSFIRKAIEAYFTLLIEGIWSKQRILEIYLNIAEFGDGVYGVKAAGETYFGTTPAQLSMIQSALMATALPSPLRYNLADPSPYMIRQRNWILQYMFYLNNTDYLNQLE